MKDVVLLLVSIFLIASAIGIYGLVEENKALSGRAEGYKSRWVEEIESKTELQNQLYDSNFLKQRLSEVREDSMWITVGELRFRVGKKAIVHAQNDSIIIIKLKP